MIRLSIFDHYYATYYKYEFLTKCEVKKTGYWPSSFFRAYGQRWSRGPLKRKKKKTMTPKLSHLITTQACSDKEFIDYIG